MSIEFLYDGLEVYCPVCGEYTHPDEWDEWEDDEGEFHVMHSECDYDNGPLDGPLRSRPR